MLDITDSAINDLLVISITFKTRVIKILHLHNRTNNNGLFPPECIFCQKIEIKAISNRKTERAECFPSWKHKANAWENIESRAKQMGLDRFYTLVKDVDLFAVEAKHHPSCLRSFRTALANNECRSATVPLDPQQCCEVTAHQKAFVPVLEYLRFHIVQRNEIVRLADLRLIYIKELKRNGYENENYGGEKLLRRIQKDAITEQLFTKVDSSRGDAIDLWLVCSSNISLSIAIAGACIQSSRPK